MIKGTTSQKIAAIKNIRAEAEQQLREIHHRAHSLSCADIYASTVTEYKELVHACNAKLDELESVLECENIARRG